jgi:hypothetical protein
MPSMTRHARTNEVRVTKVDHIRSSVAEAEPSSAELAAIESEWPLIEAELAMVDAEVRLLSSSGGPSPLDWRRLRRAEARVMRLAAEMGGIDEAAGGWAA